MLGNEGLGRCGFEMVMYIWIQNMLAKTRDYTVRPRTDISVDLSESKSWKVKCELGETSDLSDALWVLLRKY